MRSFKGSDSSALNVGRIENGVSEVDRPRIRLIGRLHT
jgi:hypothetical protein